MSSRLQDLHRSFERHLKAEGRAGGTLRLYGQSVRFFSEWLAAQGREATLDELTRPAIREWLAQLSDTHEPSTVKTGSAGCSGSAPGWWTKGRLMSIR